ncbi:MAG: hypothetical protein LUG18_15325 [Candidatus Azobacteroides sp.]|nr:hypothetical protein [Candidatus Azobacteroides sp.]
MTDRAFELAWTHNQVVLYNLNIRETEAQVYQKLAASLIYMNPALRADPALIRHNRKGQSGLWGYAVSGDYPLVILKISQPSGMELVRQLLLAHAYWRIKGLIVELVILNEDISVYRQPLHDEIISLITTGVEAPYMDKSGGVFVRPVDQMPAEDLILMQSVASVILSDKNGTLQEQIEKNRIGFSPVPDFKPSFVLPTQPKKEISTRQLLFNNGLGGFTPDGKEYIITLDPENNTSAPWSNVIANPSFGTVITESGGAYTWAVNSHEFRLTPWYNDPVKDTTGEAMYIRDENTGQYWSPTPLPARGKTPYVIRHGFGYSVFEHSEYGIDSELWVYVDMDAPVKLSVLKLKNTSGRIRSLSVTGYYEWVLGENRAKNTLHITTQTDMKTGVLYARNYYNADFSGKIGFIDAGNSRTVTGNRTEFLGYDGSMAQPLAMSKKRLSGNTGAGLDPCGAVQIYVDIQPGEEKEVPVLLGYAENEEQMLGYVYRFRQFGAVRKSLENVWQYWNRMLGAVHVETPDASVNIMANGWLLYQTLSCRIWARSGFYQSGGAFGFRDQLQDVMALSHSEPALMRQQIILAAHHQFRKGDVQHWWHPPVGRGVRTHFSDDYLWLPYVTHRYITSVGDTGILDEVIPFIEGRELSPEEESYYDLPWTSDESGTLYEHCVRSIRYGLKFGVHGLPLIGCGDWNDGMNMIGEKGKGESVWLAFFLYDVLNKFSEIATLYKDNSFADYCIEQAKQLRENIRRNAWDGRWYRRAYFDDGTPLGSKQNKECTIDVLPQSWSVISGAGDEERSRMGMQQVEQYLVDKEIKIIRLFNPPFDKFKPSPGYIKGYIPGVRENGGQYTHGTIWSILAFAIMGETERAWELFSMLNPIHHGSTKADMEVYNVEPYVIAADVYSNSQHPGRGGWTWYTGSSAWMYNVLVETLLGINRFGTELRLIPKLPEKWNTYKAHYRYYDTFYHITFIRITDHSRPRLMLDGNEQTKPDTIYLENDRHTHNAEMWF